MTVRGFVVNELMTVSEKREVHLCFDGILNFTNVLLGHTKSIMK